MCDNEFPYTALMENDEMANKVTMKFTQPVQIKSADLVVEVRNDEGLLGTLTISQGTLDWRPTRKWIGGKNEAQLTWKKFDKLMELAKDQRLTLNS